jgi:hypothetical protein
MMGFKAKPSSGRTPFAARRLYLNAEVAINAVLGLVVQIAEGIREQNRFLGDATTCGKTSKRLSPAAAAHEGLRRTDVGAGLPS